ncbi:hypothetical protein [Pedobacter heparinus]|uniref:hypothetical protein n=1 Tax=Pedobacter heparinus TaxID=984 RepID=UPI00292EE684|nr:hypothetical protein [Pedobacter heparinus]
MHRLFDYLLLTVLCFTYAITFAQERFPKPSTTRYFLNKQEISPQSVFFLNEDDIDSIGEYVSPDTSIVFYIHKPKKIISYKQLLKLYQLEEEVLKFPLSINSARKISKPELMVFSTDMVDDINVNKTEKSKPKGTFIYIQAAFKRWERDSKRAFAMVKIKKKLNDI